MAKAVENKGAVDEKQELKDEDRDDEEESTEPTEAKTDSMEVLEETHRIKERQVELKKKAQRELKAKITISAKDLSVGTLGVVYAAGAQRLSKVIANRIVREDKEAWI